jgi:outer membrane biosynthesis protein TonB
MGNRDVPQLNGKQIEIAKTENVPRPDFNKLQPAPPAQPQESPLAVPPGDLTLGKPEDSKPQEQPRPRTMKQAREQQSHRSPGVQMKEEGGMRHQLSASFDAKATPFGAYDAALVEAVTQRWYDLLDSQQFAMDRTGRVTLRFHLNYDGSITEMNVLQNTVGDLLGYVCQKALSDPAPFAPWPADMRRMIGENYREITFTFYYY